MASSAFVLARFQLYNHHHPNTTVLMEKLATHEYTDLEWCRWADLVNGRFARLSPPLFAPAQAVRHLFFTINRSIRLRQALACSA